MRQTFGLPIRCEDGDLAGGRLEFAVKIRESQLEAFQPLAEIAFERRVIEYVRAEHPEIVVPLSSGVALLVELSDETLLELVRPRLLRARDYGMTWESSLTAFVVLTFVVGATFDDHPAIRRVLSDEMIEPDLRIDQLWEQTSEEDWEAVAEQHDSSVQNLTLGVDEAALMRRLDDAWWISRDDVAREIVSELSLAQIRGLSTATRERLEHELTSGYVSQADRAAFDKMNLAKSGEVRRLDGNTLL